MACFDIIGPHIQTGYNTDRSLRIQDQDPLAKNGLRPITQWRNIDFPVALDMRLIQCRTVHRNIPTTVLGFENISCSNMLLTFADPKTYPINDARPSFSTNVRLQSV